MWFELPSLRYASFSGQKNTLHFSCRLTSFVPAVSFHFTFGTEKYSALFVQINLVPAVPFHFTFGTEKYSALFVQIKTRFVPAVTLCFTFGTGKYSALFVQINQFCPCRFVSLHFRDRKILCTFRADKNPFCPCRYAMLHFRDRKMIRPSWPNHFL